MAATGLMKGTVMVQPVSSLTNVGVFVDITNLYYCVGKKWPNRRLDFEKLLGRIQEGNSKVVRAFAYGTQTKDEANSFKNYLKKIGFDAKYKKSRFQVQGETCRSNWDVGLTVDVCRILDRLDSVIICSSNPELIPLLQYIKSRGIRVVVFACGICKLVRKHCDEYVEITEDLLYRKEPHAERSEPAREVPSGEPAEGAGPEVGSPGEEADGPEIGGA